MLCVFPKFFCAKPPVDAAQQTWEDLRPAGYWKRAAELERRGGFWATARLVAMYGKAGEEALLAIALAPWKDAYFPELMRPGALDGTCWEGVPLHLSLCFESECSDMLLEEALRKWGRPRRVWVSCERVTSGATCQLRTRGRGCGELPACRLLRRMHREGWYSNRPLHVSL